jgi:hypothetical protein
MATNLMMTSVGDAGKLLPVPQQIANLQVWLDATKDTYQDTLFATPAVANNDPIKGWKDQSGNGFHFTAGAGQWTLKTSLQNGLNGITNAATGNYLTNNTVTIASPFTVVAACNDVSSPGSNHSGFWMDTGGGSQGIEFDPINKRIGYEGPAPIFTNSSIYTLNTNYIWTFLYNSTASACYQNNAAITFGSTNPGSFSSTAVNIGFNAGFGASAYFLGNFFEIIVYTRNLTTTEGTTLYNYLHTKWNI